MRVAPEPSHIKDSWLHYVANMASNLPVLMGNAFLRTLFLKTACEYQKCSKQGRGCSDARWGPLTGFWVSFWCCTREAGKGACWFVKRAMRSVSLLLKCTHILLPFLPHNHSLKPKPYYFKKKCQSILTIVHNYFANDSLE